jgi:hypothetical protein
LERIREGVKDLWEYVESLPRSFGVSLTICPYHIDDYTPGSRDTIKKGQKKCEKYPEPNYFLDGYCYHYRPPTGHCDFMKKEEDDGDDNESQN